uniref:Putative secreted protein n=1 Tax=Anopheles darlingi TaxID=43151 RepID=A0A2M4DMV9_ANODA
MLFIYVSILCIYLLHFLFSPSFAQHTLHIARNNHIVTDSQYLLVVQRIYNGLFDWRLQQWLVLNCSLLSPILE